LIDPWATERRPTATVAMHRSSRLRGDDGHGKTHA
jgi:hypothetical protein